MNTFWLIEKTLHEDEFYERMFSALKERNVAYAGIDYMPSDGKRGITSIIKQNAGKLFVPYGCIQYVKWFCDTVGSGDIPFVEAAAFFDLKKLAFDYYSSYWGKYLLNQRNVMTTYAELKRKPDFFYEILGEDDTIFVRPVSNDKVFTGRKFYREEFAIEVRRMGYSFEPDFDPHMKVVVAAPRNVIKEWRFAVVNKKVVASTLYNVNGLHEEKEGCENEEAVKLAEMIAADPWQPDDVYALDICETKGKEVAMLEIGSLNSAGWYQMNCGAIVDAIELWRDGYEKDMKP